MEIRDKIGKLRARRKLNKRMNDLLKMTSEMSDFYRRHVPGEFLVVGSEVAEELNKIGKNEN